MRSGRISDIMLSLEVGAATDCELRWTKPSPPSTGTNSSWRCFSQNFLRPPAPSTTTLQPGRCAYNFETPPADTCPPCALTILLAFSERGAFHTRGNDGQCPRTPRLATNHCRSQRTGVRCITCKPNVCRSQGPILPTVRLNVCVQLAWRVVDHTNAPLVAAGDVFPASDNDVTSGQGTNTRTTWQRHTAQIIQAILCNNKVDSSLRRQSCPQHGEWVS